MKKIFFLVVILSFCLSVNAENNMEKTNRMMNECIQKNLCYKANASLQEVYVNEYAWRNAYIDDKESIALFFLKYTQARNPQAKFVNINSATSGKTIGVYKEYFGYKDK
ncbi:MAG: hypothetical protein BHW62_08415 [Acinetobacter sp. CAG:196_36_41]|nr:MAG: hypothetical protein BHW62_08415 [Acinetobacter sp. CAG:196_36_41]